ncbi:unnamed protein product [Brassica oleracea var. botrytis]
MALAKPTWIWLVFITILNSYFNRIVVSALFSIKKIIPFIM